jgi:glycosyltransferase involved in cell wall biosynthesis
MPFFSIIVPTYNSEATLKGCLESVLCQKFTDIEILIIDGMSNDKTLSIAKNYKNPIIRIYTETDEGIYDAMNKGIKQSQGKWLYFLGSDDELYDNEVLTNIATLINNNDNPDIIYGNVMVTRDNSI